MQGLNSNLQSKEERPNGYRTKPNLNRPAPPPRNRTASSIPAVTTPPELQKSRTASAAQLEIPTTAPPPPPKSPRTPETSPDTKKAEHRMRVAMELVTTEKSYCKSLQIIVSDYLHPLKLDQTLVKKIKVEKIFMNIEEIMLLHLPMLHDLEQCVNENNARNIGEIFVKTASYNFSLYKSYCATYAEALSYLEECNQNSTKFAAFLQSKPDKLDALLIQPVQRIPRYRLLFGELIKLTPEDHPDYPPTVKALQCVEKIAIHVNESVREKENQDKLLQIQQSFTNKVPTIVDQKRKFIREGVLVKMCRRTPKRRYFFLFSDLLIYASINESSVNSNKITYTFHRALDLSQVKVEDIPPDDGATDNAFQIRSNQKSFAVFAEDKKAKKEWMDDFDVAKNFYKSSDADTDIAPVWVPDKLVKKCMQCSGKFTTINRRHHCRKCGDLVCNSCSSKKYKLPNIGKQCRVCDICFGVLHGNADPRKEPEKKFSATKKSEIAKTATKKFERGTVRGSAMNMNVKYSSLLDKEEEEEEETGEQETSSPQTSVPSLKTKRSVEDSVAYLATLKKNSDSRRGPRRPLVTETEIFTPPPPLNADGFFEYESDEEEILPPLPPRKAPPPPPPPRN